MENRLRPDAACAASTPPAEALIGVTLALLTLYARSPNLEAADQIACNLALLARHEQVARPLQTICGRLFVDWLGPLQLQDVGPERHWKDVHDPPTVTQ
jgi:hypothetical protein